MRVLFCGDIMPGGVLPFQSQYIDPELKDYMRGFDFRVGTLESAVGTSLAYDTEKMKGRQNIIYARDEDFYRIQEMGINVVSLANNHIFDLGEAGLLNTIKHCNEFNIQHCGAGINREDASKPVVLAANGKKVAIFAYCTYGHGHWSTIPIATEDKAGVNPLEINKVVEDITEAKKRFDYVVVLPHWGHEYKSIPTEDCIFQAKAMIDAGADGVYGSHTHQVQPTITYKGKTICFSMGNFLFPDFYMHPPRPIWYPEENIDLSAITAITNYPFPITNPVKRVWPRTSRFGIVLDAHILDGSIKEKKQYVFLSKENILKRIHAPIWFSYRLWRIGKKCKQTIIK